MKLLSGKAAAVEMDKAAMTFPDAAAGASEAS
jgi:hypothetical protein